MTPRSNLDSNQARRSVSTHGASSLFLLLLVQFDLDGLHLLRRRRCRPLVGFLASLAGCGRLLLRVHVTQVAQRLFCGAKAMEGH